MMFAFEVPRHHQRESVPGAWNLGEGIGGDKIVLIVSVSHRARKEPRHGVNKVVKLLGLTLLPFYSEDLMGGQRGKRLREKATVRAEEVPQYFPL